jgi:hypothetical protein
MTDRRRADDETVLARRARISQLVTLGQRLGYSLFLVAIVGFGIGFATRFGDGLVAVIVASLVVGSLVLAPAIVFGYGVKAAERDDREHGRPLT